MVRFWKDADWRVKWLSSLAACLLAGSVQAQPSAIPGVSAELLAAARKEGELTLYTAQNRPTVDVTVAAFRKAVPGIEVYVMRQPSSPLISRYAAEYEAGNFKADVLNFPTTRLFEQHPDWWAPINAKELPAIAKWPAKVVHGHYVDTSLAVMVIAYNTKLLKAADAPKTWQDILQPRFKGRFAIVDPRSAVTHLSWVELLHKTYGPEFLTRLKEQKFVLGEGPVPALQQVAAGALDFAVAPAYGNVLPLIKEGAPLAVFSPHEADPSLPALGALTSWGISAKSKNPNAAKVFLSWVLSEEGQNVNCNNVSNSFLVDASPTCLKATPKFQSADYDGSKEHTARLLGLLGLK